MKKVKCDQCEQEIEGESFDDWFKAMHTHYTADHANIMEEMQKNGTKEDGEKWMSDAKKRFQEA